MGGSRMTRQLTTASKTYRAARATRARRVARAVTLTLTLVLGLGAIGMNLLMRRYEGAVARDNLLAPGARSDGQLVGPLNYLLIGSDRRSADPSAGQRSDTIIIAHIPRS